MKKYPLFTLLFLPIFLQAQEVAPAPEESSEEQTVSVESMDVDNLETVTVGDANDLNAEAPAVVEIPDMPIEGASIDTDVVVDLPEVTESLPSSSEVLLDIPGQGAGEGASVMGQEETISVDFPDEDVRTILRNVADLFDLNLVIPDSLQGRTSLKLRNITWRQVFEVVLEPLGFTYVEDRNIIRVKSINELSTEPVDTRVFIINYSKAEQIKGSISPLIDTASGGRIQVDNRSNSLVITERPSRMNKIQEIIDRLDRATEQVMIESKFVEVNVGDNDSLGVDWAFIHDGGVGETILGDKAGGVSAGNPGIGDTVGNVLSGSGDGLLAVFSQREYAATLSLLERDTKSRLVSNPTVVVMNNNEATFQVGEDYPIREYSFNPETGRLESGALEYRQIGIVLTVKPSVNAQGMITLDIKPKIDSIDETNFVVGPDGLADQVFDVRRVETQVTIKDGFTIALGGLTSEEEGTTQSQVPLLGDLPIVGKLFGRTLKTQTKTNLIIFLTAKTLNPDGTTYRDIIDPRMLDEIDFEESDSPGFQVPENEVELLKQVEATREELATEKRVNRAKIRVENPEDDAKEPWVRRMDIFNEKKHQ